MNIELLRQVQDRILREPERFDMHSFYSSYRRTSACNCGTSACIAGWAICLDRGFDIEGAISRDDLSAPIDGALALGLDSVKSERLFYLHKWPARFAKSYVEAEFGQDPRAAAKIAWNRIEHFIATEGRE